MPTQPINPGMKAAESAHGSNCREQIPLKCAFLRCRSRWSRITNFSGKDCICNRGSLCGPGGAKILLGSLKQVQERNLYSRPHHLAHGCGGQKLPQKNCLFGKRSETAGGRICPSRLWNFFIAFVCFTERSLALRSSTRFRCHCRPRRWPRSNRFGRSARKCPSNRPGTPNRC